MEVVCVEDELFDLDELLKDIGLDEDFVEAPEQKAAPETVKTEVPREKPAQKNDKSADHKKKSKKKGKKKKKKKSAFRKFLTFLGRFLVFLMVTALLLVGALYGVMYVLVEGPSPTARNIFVMSVRETSAIYWLADLFLTPEEIAAIEAGNGEVEEYVETDTSLIVIQKPEDKPEQSGGEDQPQGPVADEWGLIDEDGDGIIVEPVRGEGYSGYMMVVLDPSRVIMGSVPKSYGARGYTVADMVAQFDAVAGINAGGFEDPDGKGNGSIPNTMVVYEGEIYYANKGVQDGFVGFDADHIMHVGKLTANDVKEKNIQYGVSFGPVLISNGEPATLTSGVNPRTAIGQRSDGAVLMLVIDGRQVISLGATYSDLIEIFQEYGAVNACNLDGGSSTLMWFGGDYINNCASVIGIRPVPTTFLVLKEGVTNNG
jgi:exopolysaccharide biosynthesis protein